MTEANVITEFKLIDEFGNETKLSKEFTSDSMELS